MLVSAQNAGGIYGSGAEASATIKARNETATQRICDALKELSSNMSSDRRLAVIYGSAHLPGLAESPEKTLNCSPEDGEENDDYASDRTNAKEWHIAWRIRKPKEIWFACFGFVPFLLFVDGLD